MFIRRVFFALLLVISMALVLGQTCEPIQGLPCGNGLCDEGETCTNCSTDCGNCATGQTLDINLGGGVSITLVKIPAGTFRMGDLGEWNWSYPGELPPHPTRPAHDVTISNDYYMGIYEVTQAQWKAVMGTEPWKGKPSTMPSVLEQDNCPAGYLSWDDAVAFCTKLNELNPGRTLRLPTEAEWERACRAGTETLYYFGDDDSLLGAYAWYYWNSDAVNEAYAHPVGQKIKNGYELYDMHGNVWEWCSDWYGEYSPDPVVDPTGPSSGVYRVLRGGSCHSGYTHLYSAERDYNGQGCASFDDHGFRVVSEN